MDLLSIVRAVQQLLIRARSSCIQNTAYARITCVVVPDECRVPSISTCPLVHRND